MHKKTLLKWSNNRWIASGIEKLKKKLNSHGINKRTIIKIPTH